MSQKKKNAAPAAEDLQLFMQELSALQTTIHTSEEEGYDYLGGDGVCIEAENPAGGDALFIDLGDEIMLAYGDWQASYEATEEDTALALADLRALVNNELYVVTVFCRDAWLCSLTMTDTEIRNSAVIKEVREFLHTADCDPLVSLIQKEGAGLHCEYWTKGRKMIRLRPGELLPAGHV